MKNVWFGCLLFLAFLPSAFATRFSNQFIEFELPLKWNCALEGAEWVCQSTDEAKKRDAIIVLAAKLKGDQDTLEKYQEYLAKARIFNAQGGKAVNSQPKYARGMQINGHAWIDSIHLESEIPNFYTRYLATVKNDIGVLVTYSIHKTKYQEYLTQFEDMVKSLKVFRKSGGINAAPGGSIFDQVNIPSNITGNLVFNADNKAAETAPKPATKKAEDNTNLYLIVGVALAAFFIYKKKRG